MTPSVDSSNGNGLLTVPLWIDGKEETNSSTFDVVNPNSESACWNAVSATADDARRAVEAAEKAFATWSKTKPAQRAAILLKTAVVMEANAAEYGQYMATEMGVELPVAQFFMYDSHSSLFT